MRLATLVVIAALTAAADAQIVGTPLRHHEVAALHGDGPKSMEDLAGRLVLLEFFAYW